MSHWSELISTTNLDFPRGSDEATTAAADPQTPSPGDVSLGTSDSMTTSSLVHDPATAATTDSTSGLEQAVRMAALCEDFRAEDVLVLNLTGITPLFDYFVIATGSNRRQMHAIVEEIDRQQKAAGSRRKGIEGYDESTWIVEDYGDIVLHLFAEDAREKYDLEGLWADAPRVNWQAMV